VEQIGRHAIYEPNLMRRTATIGNVLWYIVQRVLAILAVLAFTYGLIAAEIELAKIEQVVDPAQR